MLKPKRAVRHGSNIDGLLRGVNTQSCADDRVPELLDAIASNLYPEGDLNGDDLIDAADLDQLTTWVEGQNP